MGSIQGLPPSTPSPFAQNNVQQSAEDFGEKIAALAQALQQLLQQRELSHDPTFLSQMQGHITALAQVAKQNTGE